MFSPVFFFLSILSIFTTIASMMELNITYHTYDEEKTTQRRPSLKIPDEKEQEQTDRCVCVCNHSFISLTCSKVLLGKHSLHVDLLSVCFFL